MHRLAIFGDSGSHVSRRLTQAIAAALRARKDVQCAAFIETSAYPPRPDWMRRMARRTTSFFDADGVLDGNHPMPPEVAQSLRHWGARSIVPASRNINHPAFLQLLREEIRPTLALSLGCGQIFRRELLAACRVVVNCHNALLPQYRGIWPTAWAAYRGETQTGFTFHYLDEGIDTGAILIQRAVAMDPDRNVSQLDHAVCELAAENAGAMLDLMIRGDRGRPQAGASSYFGRKELREIRRVGVAAEISFDELQRRLRAFKWVSLQIDGRFCEVSRFERVTGSTRAAHLVTSDGVALRASRFYFMPLPLYALYRVIRRQAPL
jgi:methionyl-tRNA formyltransferase